ncbi:MAG: type I methionyl aminopeptidase [Anaerolineales bacterium]|nr:type I methionyl aminopeptidase [Anaerolineales bacterium]MCZ2122503.1 type I methionyl aminopeptidase [Anaerolineales bacterium]
MTADSEKDIQYLKAAGRVVAGALRKMIEHVQPGMTTAELDQVGNEFLKKEGAKSAPQTVYNFPGATCISVSPVIAHGIPNETVLQAGQLINIDVSAELDGYFADTGASLVVAAHIPEIEKLLDATKSALRKAVHSAQAGKPLNDIGKVVQAEAAEHGYNVIYDLTGHGIGRKLHEEPHEVFNFHNPKDRRILTEGMVLAIEPFLTLGKGRVVEKRDHWSLQTIDKTLAAQFEHTVIVTKNEPIILTL